MIRTVRPTPLVGEDRAVHALAEARAGAFEEVRKGDGGLGGLDDDCGGARLEELRLTCAIKSTPRGSGRIRVH